MVRGKGKRGSLGGVSLPRGSQMLQQDLRVVGRLVGNIYRPGGYSPFNPGLFVGARLLTGVRIRDSRTYNSTAKQRL